MLHILVADDHSVVRRFVCDVLEADGWQVCGQATNGREAVDMAILLKPDIVVLDLSMPELNGLDAARQILKKMPKTQVLILTLHDGDDLVGSALEAGARACVVKTDLQRLVEEVRAVFQSESCSSHANALEEMSQLPGDNHAFEELVTRLTDLEREILQLLARSKTTKEIAVALSMNVKTVEICRSTIMAKLGLNSIVDCVRYALHNAVRKRP
jgi:DNA-binding NarL/FixJ family response regulator